MLAGYIERVSFGAMPPERPVQVEDDQVAACGLSAIDSQTQVREEHELLPQICTEPVEVSWTKDGSRTRQREGAVTVNDRVRLGYDIDQRMGEGRCVQGKERDDERYD